jgi:hypothetical protein
LFVCCLLVSFVFGNDFLRSACRLTNKKAYLFVFLCLMLARG